MNASQGAVLLALVEMYNSIAVDEKNKLTKPLLVLLSAVISSGVTTVSDPAHFISLFN